MYIRDLPGKGSGFFVAMRKRNYEMDMCSGALLPKILLFSLPLMLSSICLLYTYQSTREVEECRMPSSA